MNTLNIKLLKHSDPFSGYPLVPQVLDHNYSQLYNTNNYVVSWGACVLPLNDKELSTICQHRHEIIKYYWLTFIL